MTYEITTKDGFFIVAEAPRPIATFSDPDHAVLFVDALAAERAGAVPTEQAPPAAPPAEPRPSQAPMTIEVPEASAAEELEGAPTEDAELDPVPPTLEPEAELNPEETPALPSCRTMSDGERDQFLRGVIAGGKPFAVAQGLGFEPTSCRGLLSSQKMQARRAELEAEIASGRAPSAPVDAPVPARIEDGAPRRIATYGLPPSTAEEVSCGECGKSFMAPAEAIDPRCARCSRAA